MLCFLSVVIYTDAVIFTFTGVVGINGIVIFKTNFNIIIYKSSGAIPPSFYDKIIRGIYLG